MASSMKRVALITGASGGIGQAAVQLFASADWQVVAVDRKTAPRPAEGVRFVQADVSSSDDVSRVFGELAGQDGRLDTLVNNAAIQVSKPLGRVGHAIQSHVESLGYSVVREFVGHGIGADMHEAPNVPNHGSASSGPVVEVGLVIAIEPMVNAGGFEARVDGDGWTVRTADGSLSAHFEHTVAVTERGVELLTAL